MRDRLIYSLPEGRAWPIPGEALNEIEWQMRHGDPMLVCLGAASVIAAYRAILEMPERCRRETIREIRKLTKERKP